MYVIILAHFLAMHRFTAVEYNPSSLIPALRANEISQELYQVDVAVHTRDVQRCGTIVGTRPVDVGVVIEQLPHNVDVAILTRYTQRRTIIVSRCLVSIGAVLKQHVDNVSSPVRARDPQ